MLLYRVRNCIRGMNHRVLYFSACPDLNCSETISCWHTTGIRIINTQCSHLFALQYDCTTVLIVPTNRGRPPCTTILLSNLLPHRMSGDGHKTQIDDEEKSLEEEHVVEVVNSWYMAGNRVKGVPCRAVPVAREGTRQPHLFFLSSCSLCRCVTPLAQRQGSQERKNTTPIIRELTNDVRYCHGKGNLQEGKK